MKRVRINRIAMIQYSPNGGCYPASCERRDIVAGDRVEVMASDGCCQYGEVVDIQHKRWNCTKLKVENLADEVEYEYRCDDKSFEFTRTVKNSIRCAS